MRLHHLAHPLRIEQVDEALGRVLRLDQAGVVGDRRKRHPPRGVHAVGIPVFLGIVLRHLLRQERGQHPGPLPDDEVCRVGAVHHVAIADLALRLLADTLEDALGARALDLHGDAGIGRLEALGDPLRHRQVDRGVPGELALLLRRLDQGRRDLLRLGRGPHLQRIGTGRHRGRSSQHAASRELPRHVVHSSASAWHCSAGRCNHTDWPGAMARPGGAVTRSSVLSSSATV